VIVNDFGLSNENRELKLTIPCINSGEATFGCSVYEETEEIFARVRMGDQVLKDVAPDFVKIDVEGYETRVIEGLSKTIVRSYPLIITEVVEQHLQRAGTSADKLFSMMEELGYRGSRLCAEHGAIHLAPCSCENAKAEACDLAWLHEASKASERLRAAAT
jgi:Methyltransferase FkbM domain